jgi:elongation factor 1 alpha-like protein
MLVRSLGVGQLVVAVNKMDMVGWSQERFDEIEKKLSNFLVTQAGFKKQKIVYVPLCGLSGDNLTERIPSPTSQWYQGPTLSHVLGTWCDPSRR